MKGVKDADFLFMVLFLLFVIFIGFYVVIAPNMSLKRAAYQLHGAASGQNAAGAGQRGPCNDGVDNDLDGKTDYPEDEGCSGPSDPTEAFSCNDGIDNDGDGKIDSVDPQCSSKADDTENIVDTCRDSRDNDKDGLVDYPEDDGCDSVTDPRED